MPCQSAWAAGRYGIKEPRRQLGVDDMMAPDGGVADSSMPAAAVDVLMYFILPLWLADGFADYLCHRATHIETTSGPKESLIHLLLFAEMAVPILAALGSVCRLYANSEYSGLNFSVALPDSPVAQQFRLRLRMSGWEWKLVGIDLPEPVTTRLAQALIKIHGNKS